MFVFLLKVLLGYVKGLGCVQYWCWLCSGFVVGGVLQGLCQCCCIDCVLVCVDVLVGVDQVVGVWLVVVVLCYQVFDVLYLYGIVFQC